MPLRATYEDGNPIFIGMSITRMHYFIYSYQGVHIMVSDLGNQDGIKLAYVFPGQGAQFVGMGQELYHTSTAAKEVFDQVDDVLGMSLTGMMFEGPEKELQDTLNSQPAIMTMSLACLKALDELHTEDTYHPAAIAGHSLGEYTSLVASGVLDLSDGISLVRERGRLMQEASELRPGSMAAIIGLEELVIEEVCLETGAEMANINGGDQIVISGDKLCVARAIDLASIRGAKRAIPLSVSGAFHSSLMAYARDGLARAVEQLEFHDPDMPIIANSTSTPLTTAQAVKDELLNQLCSCVQWKKSVGYMMESGVSGFIEFGPGKVLGGLIKRITSAPAYKDREVQIMSVGDSSSAMKVAEAGLWGYPAR
jgi:[acyl-carrier-protein] S-malonyltransferase